MPVSKQRQKDPAEAARILFGGLAAGREAFDIATDLAPLHPRNDTFPGEVFLEVAADALEWSGASRADPVPLEGIRDRFLGEFSFRGRDRSKLQYAILAAAALRGGTEPDLLDEVYWWQSDDFWRYALYTAVAFIRLAAGRAGVPVSQVCRELEQASRSGRRDGQVPSDGTRTV
jgi:hypothetical protein